MMHRGHVFDVLLGKVLSIHWEVQQALFLNVFMQMCLKNPTTDLMLRYDELTPIIMLGPPVRP